MLEKETLKERRERYETAFLEYLMENDACGTSIEDWAAEHGLSLELLLKTGRNNGFDIPRGKSIRKQREDFSSFEPATLDTEISPVIKREKLKEDERKRTLKEKAAAKPQEETAPAPAPRKRAARNSALSLNSLMNQPQEHSAAAAPADTAAASGAQVSDADVIAKWPDLVTLYSGKPRLHSALGSASLSISADSGRRILTFKVSNEAQKSWIESKLLHELEGRFRQVSGVDDIYLRVDTAPEEERPQTIYMPSEKAKDLMAHNGEVRDLVSDFGLDVK